MALDDFIAHSDYPMDMVVLAEEGDITSFSNGYGAATLNHSLPFTPLPFGVWSIDGGTTWQPITSMNAQANQPFADVQATNSTVKVIIQSNSSGKAVKFRVFGLAPDGATGDVAPPTLRFSDFIMNTDWDYSKLVASTVWTLTATASTTVINHNLGYIPEVIAWRESTAGVISPMINSALGNAGEVALTATTSAIMAECPAGGGGTSGTAKLHIRVYGGRNG